MRSKFLITTAIITTLAMPMSGLAQSQMTVEGAVSADRTVEVTQAASRETSLLSSVYNSVSTVVSSVVSAVEEFFVEVTRSETAASQVDTSTSVVTRSDVTTVRAPEVVLTEPRTEIRTTTAPSIVSPTVVEEVPTAVLDTRSSVQNESVSNVAPVVTEAQRTQVPSVAAPSTITITSQPLAASIPTVSSAPVAMTAPAQAPAPAPAPAREANALPQDVLNYDRVQVAPAVPSEAAPAMMAPETNNRTTDSRTVESATSGASNTAARQTVSESTSSTDTVAAQRQVDSSVTESPAREVQSSRAPVESSATATRQTVTATAPVAIASSSPSTERRVVETTTRETTTRDSTVSAPTQTDAERLAAAERERLALAERERLALAERERIAAREQLTAEVLERERLAADAERLALAERERLAAAPTTETVVAQTDAERLALAERERLAAAAPQTDTERQAVTEREQMAPEATVRETAPTTTEGAVTQSDVERLEAERYVETAVAPNSWVRDMLIQSEALAIVSSAQSAQAIEQEKASSDTAAAGSASAFANLEFAQKFDNTLTIAKNNEITGVNAASELQVLSNAEMPKISANMGEQKLQVGNPACKSTIFDCSKLKSYSGEGDKGQEEKKKNDFRVEVITVGKHDQLIWIMGEDFFAPIDPVTQTGMACKDEGVVLPVGKTKDGLTTAIAFEKDKKLKAMSGESLKLFKKMIVANGKPMNEVLKSGPAVCDFGKYMTDVGLSDSNMYDLPTSDISDRIESGVTFDDKLVLLYGSKKHGKKDEAGDNKLDGIAVITVGPSAETSSIKNWKLSEKPVLKDSVSDFVAKVADDGTIYADINIPLAGKKGATIISCVLAADKDVADCKGQDVAESISVVKDTISKKIVSKSKEAIQDENFGSKVAQKISQGEFMPDATVYKFEGFGKVPNAVVVNNSGNTLLRQQDGDVAQDANEFYPGAVKCAVVDVDNYGGPDQFCIIDNGVYFLPKLNLPPKIDAVDVVNADSGDKTQLSPVVQTQEGEDLAYQWTLVQVVDGKEVDRSGYLDNATSESPSIAWPAAAAAAPVTDVQVTENAPLGKSLGAKSTSGAASDSYIARLVVTDPAGAKATGEVSLSKSLSGGVVKLGTQTGVGLGNGGAAATALDGAGSGGVEMAPPVTVSTSEGSHAMGMFGGCSLIRQ